MLRIKIFLKCSIKKLKYLKNYNNFSCYKFLFDLKNHKNRQSNIIFINIYNFIKFHFKEENLFNILNFLILKKILILPSKILKRKRFRAKGRVFDIHKKHSFVLFYFNKI